jgi:hypothetical protein
MKYYELDQDEQKILKDFEEGKLRSVRNTKQGQKQPPNFAHATLRVTLHPLQHEICSANCTPPLVTSSLHPY